MKTSKIELEFFNLKEINKVIDKFRENHIYKKINICIEYPKYKLARGFKPKESIQSFLFDSIVNSYILHENFKTKDEISIIQRAKAKKKCFESIKGNCIASETISLYPYCPYCEKSIK